MSRKEARVYIDFEFCSFENAKPISMGFVLGANRYYFEFTEWKKAECSPWVVENVLPLLDGSPASTEDIAARIRDLLSSYEKVNFVADNRIDHLILLSILGNLKPAWRCAESFFAPRSYPEFVPVGLRLHHALDDAVALEAVVKHFEAEGHNSITEPRHLFKAPRINRGRIA
jgi:hypothetical protein